MSGIVGIFNRDGAPVDREILQRMTDAMIRRGPDAQRIWAQGPVGFGHAALFTTLEAERENQPTTLDGQVWITADARIDDWETLRPKLAAKGRHIPEDVTDVQLILHAYHVWGEDCVAHLIGDFVFAIWDARQQKLFCARDHFGIKPLHYYVSDRLFVCATEIAALFALPGVPRVINEERIADFLIEPLEGYDKTSTFYRDIFRFPPAHCLSMRAGEFRLREYWRLELPPTLILKSDAEYVEAFRQHYTTAVVRRLRARRPDEVGAMLSGGIDSSSIVALARRHLHDTYGAPLHIFSAVSEDGQDLETRCSTAVAAQGGVTWHTVRPSEIGRYADEIGYLLHHTTNLFDTQMEIPQLMYVLAKHQGVRALLSGVGGDEAFSLGESYIADLLRGGHWRQAFSEAAGTARYYREFGYKSWKVLLRQIRVAYPPRFRVLAPYFALRRRQHLNQRLSASLIAREFAERIRAVERLAPPNRAAPATHRKTAPEVRVEYLNSPFMVVAFERYDSVAAAQGVEARHPIWDRHLIEFCMSLPSDQRVRRGWTKYILRQAIDGMLPELITWREGRSSHVDAFNRARHQLEPPLFELMRANAPGALYGYIKEAVFVSAMDRMLDDGKSCFTNDAWNGLALALWLRREH